MRRVVWQIGLALGLALDARAQAPDAGVASAPAYDPAAALRAQQEGTAKLRAGQVREAVELLRVAQAMDPKAAHIANDLGFALATQGARREAEAMYRRALTLDPKRWYAYVNLLDLLAESPERWHRRDELLALVERGLQQLSADAHGRQRVALAAVHFERSVGRLSEARRRLEKLTAAGLETSLRKRASDQLRAIEDDERALALADWSESPLPADAAATLEKAEDHLRARRAAVAVDLAGAVLARHPGASAPRFLRARALESLTRHDEAVADLTVLLQLRPSHAAAWRLLGIILATHGGTTQAREADDALAKALALEPSWQDLRELRKKLAPRLGPASDGRQAGAGRASERAQRLLGEAQRWQAHDVPTMAEQVLRQALADSPGYVDAAAALFATASVVLPETVRALWNDGPGLARLATEILKTRNDDETARMVRPWLDRAVALGAPEARFERAVLRAAEGDSTGALADLRAYVGSGVKPPRLDEARALRSNLEPSLRGGSPVEWARRQLLAGRPAEAARELGGSCRSGLPAESLLELGRIAEYQERDGDAVACHKLALAATGATDSIRKALDRIARIAARTPPAQGRQVSAELEAGRKLDVPAAHWALARLAIADERWDDALALGQRYLREAAADDPLREQASAALDTLGNQEQDRLQERAAQVRLGLTAAVALLVLLALVLVVRRLRGRSVAAALARVPDLYPEVALASAEVRHDVLKHRASALGMLGTPDAPAEEIARALLEPTPASAAVAAAFERLRRAAAAAGVTLLPLAREPVFGPLHRALVRAESLVSGQPGRTALRELAQLDQDLRERHGPELGALLAFAPRTRLDPAAVAAWLRPSDARDRAPGITPGLHLAVLDVDLPITPAALETIVANLVRNAVAAARGGPDPRVLVRVEEGHDAAGRRLVTFLVADSAPATVALDEIEQRDGQRGLGIVRDLVRRWGGHLVVRREPAPFHKAIGASFPIAPGPAET
jgi:tetratricopeptide (TPR) repeat protein/signal transduction histidine kinase